jgi:hypothetical protein
VVKFCYSFGEKKNTDQSESLSEEKKVKKKIFCKQEKQRVNYTLPHKLPPDLHFHP